MVLGPASNVSPCVRRLNKHTTGVYHVLENIKIERVGGQLGAHHFHYGEAPADSQRTRPVKFRSSDSKPTEFAVKYLGVPNGTDSPLQT